MLFYRDNKENIEKTWTELIYDIKNLNTYNPYLYIDNYYELFLRVIHSLIIDKEIILLDMDFSEMEINELVGTTKINQFEITGFKINEDINDKNDLLEVLTRPKENWNVTLFTSGTSGKPKKVLHDFNSISRNVKIDKKFEDKIWGFAYNPTHMAGIQVFMQAILNGSSIIRLFDLSPDEIKDELREQGITHLSSTPTFLQMLFPVNDSFKDVERVTLGGEKFKSHLTHQIKKAFPNSKITNVYASTEAGALFASSDNEVFTVKENLKQLVKIKNNELYIQHTLLGKGNLASEDGWYPTGDIVSIINEIPLSFSFTNRKSSFINVGGYKVNPHEVEEVILSLDGINNVRVYAKENSVFGNLVCCDVVLSDNNINEEYLRAYLKDKLQDYKIPRMINFTNSIPKTRTGKILRQ